MVMAILGTLQDLAGRGMAIPDLVIDAHAHMGAWHNFFIPWNDAKGMIEEMDRYGIDIACIALHVGIGPDVVPANNITAKAIKDFPGRFLGYTCINPRYKDEVIPELKRCIEGFGMFGIKLHPGVHRYSVSSPMCTPVYEYANENKLPILSHTWDNAKTLRNLAEQYPKITFLVAHSSSICAWGGEDYIELAKERNNVYLDIASSIGIYGNIERLVMEVGADKIIYGSDLPFVAIPGQFGQLIWADISEEDKLKIFGLNMKSIVEARYDKSFEL